MSRSGFFLTTVVAAIFAATALPGCHGHGHEEAPQNTQYPQTPPVEPGPNAPADNMVRLAFAAPTGDRQTSALWIERAAPAEVGIGVPFDYDISVHNLTNEPVQNVVITDSCAENFKITSSSPEAVTVDKNTVRWMLGDLGSNETRIIKIRGTGTDFGAMKNCVSASFDKRSCLTLYVVQSKITVTMTAPAEVINCDPIPVQYLVTNNGTGTARNIVLEQQLPRGLTTDSGQNTVTFQIGSLAPKESRTYNAVLRAAASGRLDHAVTVTTAGVTTASSLKADATATTMVRKPFLTLENTGPDKVLAGRPMTYQFTVTNKGDGEARDAVLEDTPPAGCRIVETSSGATVQSGKVTWKLGRLAPGASAKASLTVEPSTMGVLTNSASARAFCAEAVSDSTKTEVQGIPAILLEMVDVNDPIEIGQNEKYVVTVTNQGSASDTNIKVVCELEDSMQFVSCDGATTGSIDGKTVTFAALGSLAPKAKATWTVVVKAVREGDVRFKTSVTSDQLQRPVDKTESTRFYK